MNQAGSLKGPIEKAAVAAALFHGFSDSTRLSILLALLDGKKRVVDLLGEIGGSQSNISGHLACLKDCGLVTDHPQGRQTFYAIASKEVVGVLRAAEKLLAVNGHQIEMCPRYGTRR
ncbi:MAG: ArsR/SmtB family transcription factor [Actinomycetota bacterium]